MTSMSNVVYDAYISSMNISDNSSYKIYTKKAKLRKLFCFHSRRHSVMPLQSGAKFEGDHLLGHFSGCPLLNPTSIHVKYLSIFKTFSQFGLVV